MCCHTHIPTLMPAQGNNSSHSSSMALMPGTKQLFYETTGHTLSTTMRTPPDFYCCNGNHGFNYSVESHPYHTTSPYRYISLFTTLFCQYTSLAEVVYTVSISIYLLKQLNCICTWTALSVAMQSFCFYHASLTKSISKKPPPI